MLIWTLPDKRSHWFTSLPEAAAFVGSIERQPGRYVAWA